MSCFLINNPFTKRGKNGILNILWIITELHPGTVDEFFMNCLSNKSLLKGGEA